MYLNWMFNEPSLTILKTLSSSEWRGWAVYILCYVLKPIVSSGFLSLEPPPSTLPNNLNNIGQNFWFSCSLSYLPWCPARCGVHMPIAGECLSFLLM